MLTKNQFYNLRKQIVLNSLFLEDYENDLCVKPQTVCDFFNSALEEILQEKNIDVCDVKTSDLYNYYKSLDYDSLPRDDYQYFYNFTALNGLFLYDVIYGIEDRILIAYFYNDTYSNLIIEKPRKHKIYYDRDGEEYIIFQGGKIYLNYFQEIQ